MAPSLTVLVFRTTNHRDVSDVLLNGTNLKRQRFGVVKAKKDGWLNQRIIRHSMGEERTLVRRPEASWAFADQARPSLSRA